MPQVALGIDPDCHNCAYAFCTVDRVLRVGVVALRRSVVRDQAPPAMARLLVAAFQTFGQQYRSGPDFAVVEGQEIYLGGKHGATPDSILRLAQVAGAACAAISVAWPGVVVRLPRPKMWKGQVPKNIHQRRILAHYRLPATGPWDIQGGEKITKTTISHVVDAIGLARWGLTNARQPRARPEAARAEAL